MRVQLYHYSAAIIALIYLRSLQWCLLEMWRRKGENAAVSARNLRQFVGCICQPRGESRLTRRDVTSLIIIHCTNTMYFNILY